MSQPHLHIIALDVPLPVDYGGVMDIFYKISWLHKLGVKIHLHCFTKGRPPQDELDNYCEEVFYYQRKNFLQVLPVRLPYMVASRDNAALIKNMQNQVYAFNQIGLNGLAPINHSAIKKSSGIMAM